MTWRELLQLIREDLQTQGSFWEPGWRALAVTRFGQWRMGLPALVRKPLSLLYKMMRRHIMYKYGIDLDYNTHFGRRVRIDHFGGIFIHGSAWIGDDVVIRHNTTIGMRDDRTHATRHQAPTICDGANIGCNVTIIGPVVVGAGARVSACSLVNKSVAPNSVVGGIPAKLLCSLDTRRAPNIADHCTDRNRGAA